MIEVKKPAPQLGAWMFQKDHVQPWAYWDKLFSKVECEKIIEIGNASDLGVATIGAEDKKDTLVRDSRVAWIGPSKDTDWVFERVAAAVVALNQQFFGFDLYGMVEGFQFTKYDSPSGHYGPHLDNGFNGLTRKLSVSIQLNPSDEFDGGKLLLHRQKTPDDLELVQGKLVVFPSYALHEVTEVTRGTRYSLVCWVTGAPFR